MKRSLLTSLALLTLAAPAPAATITAFAVGTIATVDIPPDLGDYRPFEVGELVYLAFAYDPANATGAGGAFELPGASFRLATFGTQFRTSGFGATLDIADGPEDRVELGVGGWLGHVDLTFADPSGTALGSTSIPTLADLGRFPPFALRYAPTSAHGGQAFTATMTLVEALPPEPLPEPSTLVLGAIGAALACLAKGWRR